VTRALFASFPVRWLGRYIAEDTECLGYRRLLEDRKQNAQHHRQQHNMIHKRLMRRFVTSTVPSRAHFTV
jgi:hypothetical protein